MQYVLTAGPLPCGIDGPVKQAPVSLATNAERVWTEILFKLNRLPGGAEAAANGGR